MLKLYITSFQLKTSCSLRWLSVCTALYAGDLCPLCCSHSPGLDIHDLVLKQRSSVSTVKHTFVPSQDGQQMVYWWMSPEKITPQLHTVQLSCFEVYHTFGVLTVLQDSCCQKAGISHNPQEPVEHPSKIKRGRLAVPNHLSRKPSCGQ